MNKYISYSLIFSIITTYTIALFFPLTDIMLIDKYKSLPNDINVITDNIFMIAFIGYYVSIIVVVFIMKVTKK